MVARFSLDFLSVSFSRSSTPCTSSPRGVLPEDLGGGVQRASGNPYPNSDQNM